MLLYDHLIKVFHSDLFEIRYGGGIFTIKETDRNASVKKIDIEFHGQLLAIHNGIFNKTDFLFPEDEETGPDLPKLRHGCDGVLAIECKETKYLVFIELKSDYTSDNISKAEKQICASYLRIAMLLNGIYGINLDNYKNPGNVLSTATGSTACATEYILELDGFNAPMVVDLLTKRFHNYVQKYPTRGAAAELHNCDFMDMIYRGYLAIDDARKLRCGNDSLLVPKIAGFDIDLSPIDENEVVMNTQRYTYPACAITVRFSSLMRLADYPCLLTPEPVTATMMTNIIALNKEVAGSPVKGCKNCAVSSLIDSRHEYCQWKYAV